MPNELKLNEYKQEIASFYDRRSVNYDNGERRKQICARLLGYSYTKPGQKVLDIGTGTGEIAIAAAKIVGNRGKVVGVDISPEMLVYARSKANAAKLNNIEFLLADAESLDYSDNYFDCILCANTFPWLENKLATLNLWHSLLKSSGKISIHTPGDTAYIGAVVLRKVLSRYGVAMEASNRLGSKQQCIELCKKAGFKKIKIETEQHGSYISLESAKATWSWVITNPSPISLNLDRELLKFSPNKLLQVKAEFDAELARMETETGIWDEIATWYILASKI